MHFLVKVFQILAHLNSRDIAGLTIIATTLSAWIIGIQMRRKIRKDLGRKATDADLTSIDTWMKIDEIEQRRKSDKPRSPD